MKYIKYILITLFILSSIIIGVQNRTYTYLGVELSLTDNNDNYYGNSGENLQVTWTPAGIDTNAIVANSVKVYLQSPQGAAVGSTTTLTKSGVTYTGSFSIPDSAPYYSSILLSYEDTSGQRIKAVNDVRPGNTNTDFIIDSNPPTLSTGASNPLVTLVGSEAMAKIGSKIILSFSIGIDNPGEQIITTPSPNPNIDISGFGNIYSSVQVISEKKPRSDNNYPYTTTLSSEYTIYEGTIENPDDTITYTINVTDAAGNTLTGTGTFNKINQSGGFEFDNKPPSINSIDTTYVDNDNSGYCNIGDEIYIEANISTDDGETQPGNVTVDLTDIGHTSQEKLAYDSVNNVFAGTFVVQEGLLNDTGASYFYISASDSSANVKIETMTFTIDNTNPSITNITEMYISDTTLSTGSTADNTFKAYISLIGIDKDDVDTVVGIVLHDNGATPYSYSGQNIIKETVDTYYLKPFEESNQGEWVSHKFTVNTISGNAADSYGYWIQFILTDNAGNISYVPDSTVAYLDYSLPTKSALEPYFTSLDTCNILFSIDSVIDTQTSLLLDYNTYDNDDTHPIFSKNSYADSIFRAYASVKYPSVQTDPAGLNSIGELITSISGIAYNNQDQVVDIFNINNNNVSQFDLSYSTNANGNETWASSDIYLSSSAVDSPNYYIQFFVHDDYGNSVSFRSPYFDIDSVDPIIDDCYPGTEVLRTISPDQLLKESDTDSILYGFPDIGTSYGNNDGDSDDFYVYYKTRDPENNLDFVRTQSLFDITSSVTTINNTSKINDGAGTFVIMIDSDGDEDPFNVNGYYDMPITVYDKGGNFISPSPAYQFFYNNVFPRVVSSNPANATYVSTELSSITIDIADYNGDLDLDRCSFYVMTNGSKVKGTMTKSTTSDDTFATLIYTLTEKIEANGSSDGVYQIVYDLWDKANNNANNDGNNDLSFIFDSKAPEFSGMFPAANSINTAGDLSETTPGRSTTLIDYDNDGLSYNDQYVVVYLFDKTSGIDFTRSSVRVVRNSDGKIVSESLSNSNYTDRIITKISKPLAEDGSEDGVYSVVISVYDNAGKSLITTKTFVYDTKTPLINDLSEPYKISYALLNEIEDLSVRVKVYNSNIELSDYDPTSIDEDLNDTSDDILVKEFSWVTQEPGNNEIVWDGVNDLGKFVDFQKVYRYVIEAKDIAGKYAVPEQGYVIIDKTKPIITNVTAQPNPFNPTGENQDNIHIGFTSNEAGEASLKIYDINGVLVRNYDSSAVQPGVNTVFSWDGKDTTNNVVLNGVYSYEINMTDKAGNSAEPFLGTIEVNNISPRIKSMSINPNPFSPNGDGIMDTTLITFTVEPSEVVEQIRFKYGQDTVTLKYEPIPASLTVYDINESNIDIGDVEIDDRAGSGKSIILKNISANPYIMVAGDYYVKYRIKQRVIPEVNIYSTDGQLLRNLYTEDENSNGILDDNEDDNNNGILNNSIILLDSAEPEEISLIWDGKKNDSNLFDGIPADTLEEGDYLVRVTVTDINSLNKAITKSKIVKIKYKDINIALSNLDVKPEVFTPDGDGEKDVSNIIYSLSKDGVVSIKIYNEDGILVRNLLLTENRVAGTHIEVWDGKDDNGEILPTGDYKISITASDMDKQESVQSELSAKIGTKFVGNTTMNPVDDSFQSELSDISVFFEDYSDSNFMVDVNNSYIMVTGPQGIVDGSVSSGVDTSNKPYLKFTPTKLFATDGSEDGEYKVLITALKNLNVVDTGTEAGIITSKIVKKFVYDSKSPYLTKIDKLSDNPYTNNIDEIKIGVSDKNLNKTVSLPNLNEMNIVDSGLLSVETLQDLVSGDTGGDALEGSLVKLFSSAGSEVRTIYTHNGIDMVTLRPSSTFKYDGSTDDTYTIVAIFSDKAGNVSGIYEQSFILDTRQPDFELNVDGTAITKTDFAPQFAPQYAAASYNSDYPVVMKTSLNFNIRSSENLVSAPTVTIKQARLQEKQISISETSKQTWQGKYNVVPGFEGAAKITISGKDYAGNEVVNEEYYIILLAPNFSITKQGVSPNPFPYGTYDCTYFYFKLSTSITQVKIRIFNLSGQLVKTIDNELNPLNVEYYKKDEFKWNGDDNNGRLLPNGVYIYKMSFINNGTVLDNVVGKVAIVR